MWKFFEKIIGDKKEYREMMARVKKLPKDYQYVYEKMQKYMWSYASGDGYDMLKIQYDLIDLFEEGAADEKPVLDVTGEDVAAFCDELIQNAKTYTGKWKNDLNKDIKKKLDH